MRGITPILRLIGVALIDFAHWGLDPLSPYAAKAILLRNKWERPL